MLVPALLALGRPLNLWPVAGIAALICGAMHAIYDAICHIGATTVRVSASHLSVQRGWARAQVWPWSTVTSVAWSTDCLCIGLAGETLRIPSRLRGMAELADVAAARSGCQLGSSRVQCPAEAVPTVTAGVSDLPPSYVLVVLSAMAAAGLAGIRALPLVLLPMYTAWSVYCSTTAEGLEVRRWRSRVLVPYSEVMAIDEWGLYAVIVSRYSEHFVVSRIGPGGELVRWLRGAHQARIAV